MRTWTGLLLLLSVAGCDPGWKPVDADGDGYLSDVDCWDNPATSPVREGDNGYSGLRAEEIHPDAPETFYDGVDQNCDGGDDYDQDGDGFRSARHLSSVGAAGVDCFDAEEDNFTNEGGLDPASVNPGATETWYDGTDADCSGGSDYDQDGDGHDSIYYTFPSATQDDCFDAASDVDEHGFTNDAGLDPADVYGGVYDLPYDGTDADCSGNDDFDQDGDGAICTEAPDADGACDGDCDDGDPNVAGMSDEIWYDGVDQDCDGNDGDQDGDGYYVADYPFSVPEGYRTGDCADTPGTLTGLNGLPDLDATAVNPGAASDTWYDGIDENCDGADDLDQDGDGAASLYQLDASGGYGTDCYDTSTDSFDNPAGLSPDDVYPGASDDPFDATDADCAGDAELDLDGDGDIAIEAGGGDCDDLDPTRASTFTESCGTAGLDDNCDGVADEADADGCSSYYTDGDLDGYGAGAAACLCAATSDYSATTADDCDDAVATTSPAGVEDCATTADDDCDGVTNEIDVAGCVDLYEDGDGDGFGDLNGLPTCICEAPDSSWVSDHTDCDDADGGNAPGNTETCDAADNNCDGAADEDLPLFYADEDEDGFGDPSGATSCDAADVNNGTADMSDCDDSDGWVYPGAEEHCDGVQNDCDLVGWTDAAEDGLVTEIVSSGDRLQLDWSAYVGTPSTLTLTNTDQNATFNLCRGTWNLGIIAPSNVSANLHGLYGADETVLDGAGSLTTLLRVYDNSYVHVTGLTLTGGTGIVDASGIYIGGGAMVHTNSTGQGTTDNPNLMLTESLVTGNTATRGAGIAIGRGGSATRYGYVKLVDTLVTENVAEDVGGGAWVNLGVLECVASDATVYAGLVSNTADAAGGAYIYGYAGSGVGSSNGVVLSDGCDWGVAGIDDNSPDDLGSHGDAVTSSQGVDASFTCTYADCP